MIGFTFRCIKLVLLLVDEWIEHLYDRENPKSNLRYKGTGVEGLFYGVPNINERAEVIARALAKYTYDDLTRFTMQSQKISKMEKAYAFSNLRFSILFAICDYSKH